MKYGLMALGAATLAIAGGSAASAQQLNMICSADIRVCERMVRGFESATEIDVNMVRLSSGEAYARVRAESRNPKTDIWWAGTGDPHLQAAADGLTMKYKSPMLPDLYDWAQKQAKISGYRTVGVYSGALGWGYNTDIFEEEGLDAPQCWKDLLESQYEGEIEIANPNSSGTAYTMLATMVQLMGEDAAFDYLEKLNDNVIQYTKSGSAPVKAAARGEAGLGIVFMHDAVAQTDEGFPIETVAPCEGTGYEIGSMSIIKGARNVKAAKRWYDWALTAEAQSLMKEAKSFQLPSNPDATVSDLVPDLDKIKLIDYDFEQYGSSDRRRALLERWDREIGAIAR